MEHYLYTLTVLNAPDTKGFIKGTSEEIEEIRRKLHRSNSFGMPNKHSQARCPINSP